MEDATIWQGLFLCGIVSWIWVSSYFKITQKFRSLMQPWVTRQVVDGVPFVIKIQKHQNWMLDAFFSGLSCVVSVPFYTAFLPFLFWSGHGRLARQMTLLIALCDYLGNSLKDVVSAPRPSCPPVRRITATKDEEDNAVEYGLPSSHTLNTLCLSGYLLYYVLSTLDNESKSIQYCGIALVCLFVGLIAFGRIYLGMHSVVDIIGGLAMGLVILSLWLAVCDRIDIFITSKQNVSSFWTALSLLLLFAYPTPERSTPSYEYHTAFNGVALGIVTGVQQTYSQFHHEAAPRIFSQELPFKIFLGRILVGMPTILVVKFCSKSMAKWILPTLSNTVGIPVRSSTYIPKLNNGSGKKSKKKSGYLCEFLNQDSFDVDTGIRFIQYAGLAWSVVDLVPSLFLHFNL